MVLHKLKLCVAILIVATCSCGRENDHGLYVDSFEYDLGDIPKGQRCDCKARIKNNTGKAIKVKSVLTGCSCITASIDNKRIKKHSTTYLNISFDSSSKAEAYYEYSVILYIDTSPNPYLFKVKANVLSPEQRMHD